MVANYMNSILRLVRRLPSTGMGPLAIGRKNHTTSRLSMFANVISGVHFLARLYRGKGFRIGALIFYSWFAQIQPKVFQIILLANSY